MPTVGRRILHGGGARLRLAGLALGVVISACASQSLTDDPGLSDEDRAYLDGVQLALRLFDERNEAFRQALSHSYQTNEALFRALASAGAGGAFEPGLAALTALRPPARFADDHRILLERQQSLVLIDRALGTAVAEGDVDEFMLLNMRLGLASVRPAVELQPPVCDVVMRNGFAGHETQPAEYLADAFCDSAPLPGGGYGDRVRAILRNVTIEVDVRAQALGFFGLLPVIDEEAISSVAGEAFTEIMEEVRRAAREIRALEPPERMRGDHQHLVAYLDEVEQILDGLVDAALTGDMAAFEATAFADLYCRTRSEIGLAYRPIVRVQFADMFGFCPGSGTF